MASLSSFLSFVTHLSRGFRAPFPEMHSAIIRPQSQAGLRQLSLAPQQSARVSKSPKIIPMRANEVRAVHDAAFQQMFHKSNSRRMAIMMPAMSPFMTQGKVRQWKKREGDTFVRGDIILEIESDIAILDIRAEGSGIMGRILVPDGAMNVNVEEVLALVQTNRL